MCVCVCVCACVRVCVCVCACACACGSNPWMEVLDYVLDDFVGVNGTVGIPKLIQQLTNGTDELRLLGPVVLPTEHSILALWRPHCQSRTRPPEADIPCYSKSAVVCGWRTNPSDGNVSFNRGHAFTILRGGRARRRAGV